MLIEFFGLPGAGKSTMSRQVADVLLKAGVRVDEITYDLDHVRDGASRLLARLGHLLVFLLCHPIKALSAVARIAATRQTTTRDFAKATINWMLVLSLASRQRTVVRVTFLDQGIAQALWSVGFAARRKTWLDTMWPDARGAPPKPDMVVLLRASIDSIVERLNSRPLHASRVETIGFDDDLLRELECRSEAIVQRLRSAGVKVIEVPNNSPEQLARGAALIASAILTILGKGVAGEAGSSVAVWRGIPPLTPEAAQ